MKTRPRAEKTALALVAGESQQLQAAWGNAKRQIALREELLAREKQAPVPSPEGRKAESSTSISHCICAASYL